MGAIRCFLAEFKLSVDAIDRIVCMGWYGRLPLLSESLREVFRWQVLLAEQLPTLGFTVNSASQPFSTKRQFDLDELKQIAKQKGVAIYGEADKRYIIHAIQKAEGSTACFGVGSSVTCGQNGCCWRNDCKEFKLNGLVDAKPQMMVVSSDPAREKVEKERSERLEREMLIHIDHSTALQWVCNANLAGKVMNWESAKEWVSKLNYGGYSNWRLPTKDELSSFAEKGGKRPAEYFNAHGFRNVKAYYYWSSSAYANYTYRAWFVNMYDGYVYGNGKPDYYYVWPVRSGQ